MPVWMRLPLPTAAGERWLKEMALAVEWLPEEWPYGIPSLKQLLVVTPLTASILLHLAVLTLNLEPGDREGELARSTQNDSKRRSIETRIETVL